MSFDSRRARAQVLLQATGILRGNYEPPIVRLLWCLGCKVPPPHFVPFLPMLVLAGAWFSLAWGVMMWVTMWSRRGLDPAVMLRGAGGSGLLFGLFMASYHAHGRRKYGLPAWKSL